ncbi:MAG: hypothetical protein ACK48Y_11800, partial [Planctomyces sp.]
MAGSRVRECEDRAKTSVDRPARDCANRPASVDAAPAISAEPAVCRQAKLQQKTLTTEPQRWQP